MTGVGAKTAIRELRSVEVSIVDRGIPSTRRIVHMESIYILKIVVHTVIFSIYNLQNYRIFVYIISWVKLKTSG